MRIKEFNTQKITTNITMSKTKILMTSIVATILITGMVAMSSPQVFANPIDSEVTIGFDDSTPNAGEIVAITGTVTTLFTQHGGPGNAGGADHEPMDPMNIDSGLGKIQQGFVGDNPPIAVSDCEVGGIDWVDLSNDVVVDSMWTHEFDTDGLGGQTLVFRAHFAPAGSGIAQGMSECTELEIGGDPIDGFKTWTHTDYNWEYCDGAVNPEDHLCYEDETFAVWKPFVTANINNPDHDVLADSLDPPTEDGISDVLVQVKENGEISNMNPGAIYALTTVHVLTDLDMLQVDENYGDCTDVELELLNQNNLSRNVKVAVADPNGDVTEVTDRLYDELDLGVIFVEEMDDNSAKVKINDSTLLTDGSTVFVLVKFDDQLKGDDSSILPLECVNSEDVTATIGQEIPYEDTYEATLRFTEAPQDN